ncbi:MAG: GtrA family protein [Gammaproteobacteria bacterium]|nr:GtrA family protein [Gammaproteobacteria bacterium]
MIKKPFRSQFCFFALAGGCGFIIDFGVFYLLHLKLNFDISRVISILCAMTVTWIFNRTLTFKVEKKATHVEWIKYMLVNGTGATINFSIFMLLTRSHPALKQYFIVPFIIATSISMWFNFALAKFYIFKKRKK